MNTNSHSIAYIGFDIANISKSELDLAISGTNHQTFNNNPKGIAKLV